MLSETVGYAAYVLLSSNNGNLYLPGDEKLYDKLLAISGMTARREPDSRLSLIVEEDALTVIRSAARRPRARMVTQPNILFPAINGKSRASELTPSKQ